ncbi:crotonase/enoyl-CoA hydratase family protein [Actinomycetospora callitridis]|uniref:crotonase/enoyl-CoA hydratase family protein n=1 Tax=Actinomycetospora callitridis TaxID=913944 RepID=UPI002366C8A4|nr:crotonase/enoyl-CoA hydratase family protein [Actinomycetospora callitridis]MDD7917974.1 crotonase/enoyl-CoA hydratase family protein [Actinomycetospora callitridis]
MSTLDLDAPATPTALSVTHDGGVATVRLERPEAANALDRTLWRELRDTFTVLDADPGVRVVVLAGAGKHFCAGIDLSMLGEIQGMAPDGADPGRAREALRRLILDLQDVLTTVERCRVPVLAAIQGVCVGAGLDLAVACDLRYATPRTKFSLKEVDMGLAADVGVLQRLPRIVGEGRAREMAYTCRDVRGPEAETMGLVNACVEADDPEALVAHVQEIARGLAAKSPLAMRGTKHAITYARDHSVADGLDQIATWNASALISEDLTEAVTAFSQGRAPRYAD